jgi:endoglycosylceramidase
MQMRRRLVGVVTVLAIVTTATACAVPATARFPSGAGGVVSVAPPDMAGPLHLRGRQLVDAEGRVVLIHGINSVNKAAPFISPLGEGWLGPDELERLRAEGMNGVRLGVWAAGLLPEPGAIDHDYLDDVAEVVDALDDAGFWVLLDFHQDVFWGMPTWATTATAAAASDEPSPLLSWIGWAAAYTTERSNRQWQDWWSDVEIVPGKGVQELYADGVAAVAARFADAPNVVGIDLLNEPYPGADLFQCLQSCPGRYQQVASAFTGLTDAVRAVAPQMPVWWEPFTLGPPFPGVADPGEGIGLSFHTYCLHTDGGTPVAPSPAEQALCDGVYDAAFDGATAVSRRWDAPAMLTEFGASQSPLNATGGAARADEQLISWFHWHGTDDYPEVVRTQLLRTYAQATAGTPTRQHFEPATGAYELRYLPDHTVDAPTSIVVPGAHHPDGYEVTVTGGTVTSPPDAGRLTVVADPGSAEVVVRVRRA